MGKKSHLPAILGSGILEVLVDGLSTKTFSENRQVVFKNHLSIMIEYLLKNCDYDEVLFAKFKDLGLLSCNEHVLTDRCQEMIQQLPEIMENGVERYEYSKPRHNIRVNET